MKSKRILRDHLSTIIYTDRDWSILKTKRTEAIKLLEIFFKEGFNPFIHGSIARGDVNESSDFDIIFLRMISPFIIEIILNNNGYEKCFKEIIMATPLDTIKLYIYLGEIESITIPLSKPDKNFIEFYNFGGKINLNQLKLDIRVPGIDKRLVLIKPNIKGHEEISIIGNEAYAAKEVGISINTINERKKVLLRRNKHGRTGVFLKRQIQINESTEDAIKKLAKQKSIVRKKLFKI